MGKHIVRFTMCFNTRSRNTNTARECVEVGLDFVPRRVNPGYHKELMITNRRNRGATELMFTLRANCVDDQGLSLHALYYRVLAPNPQMKLTLG